MPKITLHRQAPSSEIPPPVAGVKHIIAIASGKGGVGKSTTAANLALAISKTGVRVGLLDADIYGPSLPRLFEIGERATQKDNKTFVPIVKYGIQCMSLGFLIGPHTPAIWRGPMATMAVRQLLRDTCWDAVDFLIVDLPPGTGDIHLTLTQKIPLVGAIIITTPQPMALHIARKGLEMFRKVNVPILGIIENMSVYHCPNCGHREHFLGKEGGAYLAQETGVECLGQIPFDTRIREQADCGTSLVLTEPEGSISRLYKEIAEKLLNKIMSH